MFSEHAMLIEKKYRTGLLPAVGGWANVWTRAEFVGKVAWTGIWAAFMAATTLAAAPAGLPSLEQAMQGGKDVWGEAALREPNGPSYEFFAPLLPPPRYVNADFRHYPIVLSAPNAKSKARLISNGSGVNLSGGSRSWNNIGTPAMFRVGPDEFLFGSLADRVTEPVLAEGWLPIVEIRYRHRSPLQSEGVVPLDQPKHDLPSETYRLEAFASTDAAFASNGLVFAKFDLTQGTNGFIAVQFDSKSPFKFTAGKLEDEAGRLVALFDSGWKWERGRATARLRAGKVATLAIATQPLDPAAGFKMSGDFYAAQRETCAGTWRKIVDGGMNVEVPETLVNHAWKNLLCQNFELINGDRFNYSAGNQYEQIYEAEGSDAALAMMWWGYESDMKRVMSPLLAFTRKGLEYHQAAFKLIDVCRYYWQTRDAGSVMELRPRWEKEARRLMENHTAENGLFPKEQYCGDIHTPVYSLNVNAMAWRAIRDLGAVLGDLGDSAEAKRYSDAAESFKRVIGPAIDRSVSHETTPPFVPVALFGDEPVHDPILHSRIGSYWNIIIGYAIASGVFPPGSEAENWIPHYLETHGGLCMGMLRSGGGQFNFWTSDNRVNPLYGTRYLIDTLRRDDPDRALVGFYGMLAQGFTRNTFVVAEGCDLTPLDQGGRIFYCPPNSAGNSHLLSTLRHLLVQDFDLDGDGKPETLRLLFGTSRRWLEDGKTIRVERAPTAFGPVSVKVESHLSRGEVIADVDLPTRSMPDHSLLRIRLPEGWRVTGARTGGAALKVDDRGTVDLTGMKGAVQIQVIAVRP
jgi:hypothetical protein